MAVKIAAGWWIGLGVLARVLLVACPSKYNWRAARSNEGTCAADYLIKPTVEAHPITISGQCTSMTVQAASVSGTPFAIGMVELPADDPVWCRRAVEALRNGLSTNLRGHVAERDIVVQVVAQSPLSLPALELIVFGTGGDDPVPHRPTTCVVATGEHTYRVVMLESGDAARNACQQEQVDRFPASFHPY